MTKNPSIFRNRETGNDQGLWPSKIIGAWRDRKKNRIIELWEWCINGDVSYTVRRLTNGVTTFALSGYTLPEAVSAIHQIITEEKNRGFGYEKVYAANPEVDPGTFEALHQSYLNKWIPDGRVFPVDIEGQLYNAEDSSAIEGKIWANRLVPIEKYRGPTWSWPQRERFLSDIEMVVTSQIQRRYPHHSSRSKLIQSLKKKGLEEIYQKYGGLHNGVRIQIDGKTYVIVDPPRTSFWTKDSLKTGAYFKRHNDWPTLEQLAKLPKEPAPVDNPHSGHVSAADQKWIKAVLMPYFKIKALRISWSDSQKKYPDIWCQLKAKPPHITVTAEWARQNVDERRKRLVHECIHIAWGIEDNRPVQGFYYSTYPDKDTFSQAIYFRIRKEYATRKVYDPRWVGERRQLKLKNPKPLVQNAKRIYEIYLDDIRKRWDWHGIQTNLAMRLAGGEETPYFYLGNYLQIGPDAPLGQHYYNKIYWMPSMGAGGGYRIGEWFTALADVAEKYDLHVLISQEDPTDLYVTPGLLKSTNYGYGGHAVDTRIEGFNFDAFWKRGQTTYATRVVTAEEQKKRCQGCGYNFERDDPVIVQEIKAGKQKEYGYTPYNTQMVLESPKRRVYTGRTKDRILKHYWHRACWFNAHRQEDWYRPGILAEPPEEPEPQFLPPDYKFTPVVDLPPGEDEPEEPVEVTKPEEKLTEMLTTEPKKETPRRSLWRRLWRI